MRNLSIAVALAALLGSSAVAQAAGFSEDFSVGQTASTNNTSSGFDAGNTLAASYGSRALFTDILANTAPGDARARTAINGGAFTYSSDTEVTGLGFVVFNFNTPINLTLTPLFQLTLLSNDEIGTFHIQATDSGGTLVDMGYTLPVVVSGAAPLTLTVPANFTGVNRASVTKLTFYFGGTKGEDLSVDSITAIPEPGSLGTVALLSGLAGAGLLIRRRRA